MRRFVQDSRLASITAAGGGSGDAAESLEELRREVARRCPEWMELNAGDPRSVLLEVFAEALAAERKRIDQLQDDLFPRLLDALAEDPRQVVPAQGVIQFVVRGDVGEASRVPRGTVVSAPRQSGEPHIAYETITDAWCSSARLLRVVTVEGSGQREWIPFPQSGWDRCAGAFPADRVRPQRYLYLGDPVLSTLRSDAGELVLEWPALAADGEGRHLIGGDWECSVGRAWRRIRLEWEQVGGSTPVLRSRVGGGLRDISEQSVDGLSSVWLRCALPGDADVRLSTPEWISSSAVPPGSSPGASGLGRVAFNFPRPVAKVLTRHEEIWRDHTLVERRGDRGVAPPQHTFDAARCSAEWDTAVYLGWDRPVPASVYWQLEEGPARRGATDEPVSFEWEFFGTDGFSPFEVHDGTRGFSGSGSVRWDPPSGWTKTELHGEDLYWLRARWTTGGYVDPPCLRAIVPHGVGIRQGRVIENVIHEVDFDARGRGRLSASCAHGEPQSFDLLELQSDSGTWLSCRVAAGDTGDAAETAETADGSQPTVRVRRLAGGDLEIDAGPTRRGAVSVRFPRVRFCHGKEGDLPPGSLQILESDHPAVARLAQPLATTGGMDSESAEELRHRVVAEWSASHRIVTLRDLRLMCQALAPELARVEAEVDPVDAGLLRVTVVPREPYGRPSLSPPRLRWLEEELQDRLPIGTIVDAREPAYVRVEVIGRRRPDGPSRPPPASVRRAVELRLREFFHPVEGGADRRGLPACGWLPEKGGFSSLMSVILSPPVAGSSGPQEPLVSSLVGWRFDLVVPGGAPPSWRQRTAAEIVFPVLGRLSFEEA